MKFKFIYLEKLLSPLIVGLYSILLLKNPDGIKSLSYPRSGFFMIFWVLFFVYFLILWFKYLKSDLKEFGFDYYLVRKDTEKMSAKGMQKSIVRRVLLFLATLFFIWGLVTAFWYEFMNIPNKLVMDFVILLSLGLGMCVPFYTYKIKKEMINKHQELTQ